MMELHRPILLMAIAAWVAPLHASAFDKASGPRAAGEASMQLLETPHEYRSAGGVLDVSIEARATQVSIGRHTINGSTYNGVYGGPVLRLLPGDTLRMHFVNHLKRCLDPKRRITNDHNVRRNVRALSRGLAHRAHSCV